MDSGPKLWAFSLFPHLCLYMYVCMYVGATCSHIHMHFEGQGEYRNHRGSHFYPYSLRQSFSIEPELTDMARLTSHLALRIPGSTSQGWITSSAAHLSDICACWQYKLWSSHLRDKSLTVDVFKGLEVVTQTPQEHKSHSRSLLGLVANLAYLVAP